MARYTGQEIAERAIRFGATPTLARIMGAAAMAEGGGDSDAVGDNGTSIGAFQINDIHGLTGDQRRDLDFATQWMLDQEFAPAFIEGWRRGYIGEAMARWCCMRAERPYGWNGPNDPGLDSPAADRYAAEWRALERPMPTTRTYNPDQPAERQIQPWACSIRTATWMLKSLGFAVDAGTLQDAMVPTYVTPESGLLDWRGFGLRDFLATYDLAVQATAPVTWDQVAILAGSGPIGLGGQAWNHWVAVRRVGDGVLELANPAPGWMGVGDNLWPADFQRLGPMAMVYATPYLAPPAPEPIPAADPCAPLISQLGYLQGDVADALQAGVDGARAAKTKAQREDAYQSIEAALATLRRGGA